MVGPLAGYKPRWPNKLRCHKHDDVRVEGEGGVVVEMSLRRIIVLSKIDDEDVILFSAQRLTVQIISPKRYLISHAVRVIRRM